MTRDGSLLLLYGCAVIAATVVHDLRALAAMLALAAILAGRDAPRVARRALLAILLFNSVVTISYASLSLYRGDFSGHYVALLNLRVFLVTFLTFLMIRRVNPFRALGFSRTLQVLLTLATSQIIGFRRTYEDFRLALRSRMPGRPAFRHLGRHGAAAAAHFLDKAIHNADEVGLALRSRGFFDD
ncbi:MAG: ABC transporter permease [Candidatus Eisenbacteria bacterium]|nr:ABC transporter permease [Candidatus Eisenbacteria bacterium]